MNGCPQQEKGCRGGYIFINTTIIAPEQSVSLEILKMCLDTNQCQPVQPALAGVGLNDLQKALPTLVIL